MDVTVPEEKKKKLINTNWGTSSLLPFDIVAVHRALSPFILFPLLFSLFHFLHIYFTDVLCCFILVAGIVIRIPVLDTMQDPLTTIVTEQQATESLGSNSLLESDSYSRSRSSLSENDGPHR